VSVLTLPQRNPVLAHSITVVPDIRVRTIAAALGVIV
jgi:hypothetical protein